MWVFFVRELCSKYRETEVELLEAYEQLKVEAKRVEDERNQVNNSWYVLIESSIGLLQCLQDFASLERSFTDFHQRYNKSKELVTSLQKVPSCTAC